MLNAGSTYAGQTTVSQGALKSGSASAFASSSTSTRSLRPSRLFPIHPSDRVGCFGSGFGTHQGCWCSIGYAGEHAHHGAQSSSFTVRAASPTASFDRSTSRKVDGERQLRRAAPVIPPDKIAFSMKHQILKPDRLDIRMQLQPFGGAPALRQPPQPRRPHERAIVVDAEGNLASSGSGSPEGSKKRTSAPKWGRTCIRKCKAVTMGPLPMIRQSRIELCEMNLP